MDMLFSPDGDLYIIEYGRKWFARNSDARLLRIQFNGGNRPPVPELELAHKIGAAPFQLVANAEGSIDYDGDELSYRWLIDDAEVGTGPLLEETIEIDGEYYLTLEVTDVVGNTATKQAELLVGNSVPEVAVALSGNRTFFFPGETVNYDVQVTDVEDGTIDPSAITVSLDYLEGEDLVEIERGHQVAGESTAFAIGKSLIGELDCGGCHMEQEKSIGPSYQAVADRYRRDQDGAEYLAGKIISGGGGVWGEQAMSAHPELSEGDAKQMAEYILSLAGPAPDAESRPAKGSLVLDQHKPGIPGRYYLQASYTDQGGGDGLPRLTTREVVVLRQPVIPAHKFTKGKKVMAYHVEAKDNPLSDEDTDVLVASGGGWASYGAVDLTGIRTINAGVALVPNITSGGIIEVLSGDPRKGQVIGTAEVKQKLSNYGLNTYPISLSGAKDGVQEIYFRFKADSDAAEAVLGAISTFEFVRDQATK